MPSKSLPLIRVALLRPFLRVLERNGGDPDRYLEALAVSPEIAGEAKGWIAKRQHHGVTDLAAREEGIDGFGFRAGDAFEVADFGPVGRAMIEGPTFFAALSTFREMIALHDDNLEVCLEESGRDDVWLCARNAPLEEHPGQVLGDHFALLALLKVVRLVAGPGWRPAAGRLQTPPVPLPSSIEGIANTRITFNERSTGVRFPKEFLSRRVRPALRAPEKAGNALPSPGPSASVADSLGRILESQFPLAPLPTVDTAAEIAGTSRRSLLRILAEEQCPYQRILDRIHFDAAERMLANPKVTVRKVAAELRFSSPNAFIRCFRRMTGVTPGVYRRVQLGQE